jgi:hypothetical protein
VSCVVSSFRRCSIGLLAKWSERERKSSPEFRRERTAIFRGKPNSELFASGTHPAHKNAMRARIYLSFSKICIDDANQWHSHIRSDSHGEPEETSGWAAITRSTSPVSAPPIAPFQTQCQIAKCPLVTFGSESTQSAWKVAKFWDFSIGRRF